MGSLPKKRYYGSCSNPDKQKKPTLAQAYKYIFLASKKCKSRNYQCQAHYQQTKKWPVPLKNMHEISIILLYLNKKVVDECLNDNFQQRNHKAEEHPYLNIFDTACLGQWLWDTYEPKFTVYTIQYLSSYIKFLVKIFQSSTKFFTLCKGFLIATSYCPQKICKSPWSVFMKAGGQKHIFVALSQFFVQK